MVYRTSSSLHLIILIHDTNLSCITTMTHVIVTTLPHSWLSWWSHLLRIVRLRYSTTVLHWRLFLFELIVRWNLVTVRHIWVIKKWIIVVSIILSAWVHLVLWRHWLLKIIIPFDIIKHWGLLWLHKFFWVMYQLSLKHGYLLFN